MKSERHSPLAILDATVKMTPPEKFVLDGAFVIDVVTNVEKGIGFFLCERFLALPVEVRLKHGAS